MHTMKEVAKMMNLPAHTLRYYEECGILTEIQRNSIGQRIYTPYNLEQINLIKCLRACGLSIKEVRMFFESLRTNMPSEDRIQILKKHHEYLDVKQREISEAIKLLEIKIDYFSKQI